jgi:hypothetical protein
MTNEEIDLTLAMRHARQHHYVGPSRSQKTAFIISLYERLKRGIAEGFPYAGCPHECCNETCTHCWGEAITKFRKYELPPVL